MSAAGSEPIERDDVIDRLRARLSHVGVAPDRAYDGGGAAPAGELGGESADASEHAVHEDGGAGDRSVAEHRPVCGDAGDAEARADLVGHGIG